MNNELLRQDVRRRLLTIKGHIAGIERMVESGQECEDVLLQLSAVNGAVNKLRAYILTNYTEGCLQELQIDDVQARRRLDNLTKMMLDMLKR